MREVVENKIRKLPRILETELMTVLKTKKEEQIVSLKKDIGVHGKYLYSFVRYTPSDNKLLDIITI